MNHLKARIFALLLISCLRGFDLLQLASTAAAGKLFIQVGRVRTIGVVGGFFLLMFPGRGGKPLPQKSGCWCCLVFVIGLIAGLINVYLMDPGMFGK